MTEGRKGKGKGKDKAKANPKYKGQMTKSKPQRKQTHKPKSKDDKESVYYHATMLGIGEGIAHFFGKRQRRMESWLPLQDNKIDKSWQKVKLTSVRGMGQRLLP